MTLLPATGATEGTFMRRTLIAALAAAAAITTAAPAMAAVTVTGTSGTLAASATFDVVGGDLQVTLTNTAAGDVNFPTEILHALFFDIAGTPSLTYTSANICGTCTFTGTVQGTGTDVGAEWAFKQNAGGLGSGVTQSYGLSSSGYGIFGPGNVLSSSPDRGGNASPPGGADFGLVSAGYTTAGDNGGVTNNQPYIKNSVIFDLGAFNGSLDSISNVRFQYGTALSDPSVPGVPEPATWAMMLVGFGGIGMAMRRRRRGDGRLMQIA
jgi:hypothetical protein